MSNNGHNEWEPNFSSQISEEKTMTFADVLKTPSGKILADPETGMPIYLAVRAPGQVAAQPDPSGISILRGATGGNPNADPKTGRFASGDNTGSGVRLNDTSGLWEKLTPEAQQYIQAQVQAYSPDEVLLKQNGTEVAVVLRKAGSPILAFNAPTIDSDEEAKAALQIADEQSAGPQNRTSIPDGVDPDAWHRRQDMVRAAARENDDMDAGDLKEFLKGRVPDMSQIDQEAFLRDVRAQRMDDLLDILDQQTRPKIVGMQISRRMVKTVAPKGFARRVFNGLSDDEIINLIKRLEGRGYDPEDLTKFVVSGITNEDRRSKLEQLYGQSKPKTGKKAAK
jgi:hypothetical protein